jgi:hypothetical protein
MDLKFPKTGAGLRQHRGYRHAIAETLAVEGARVIVNVARRRASTLRLLR